VTAVTANETASKASLAELLRSVGGPQLVEQARDCGHKSRDHPVKQANSTRPLRRKGTASASLSQIPFRG